MAVLEDGFQCPPAPEYPYVSVLVAPRADDGSPTMKNWFSAGDQPVGACAQAVLGSPGTGTGIAVTISKCEWFLSTGDGTEFATPPDPPAFPFTINVRRDAVEYRSDPADPATNFYVENEIVHPGDAPIAGSETVLATHDTKDPIGTCGDTAPGNFGWLESDNCYVEVGDPYTGDTGNDPEPCYEAFKNSRDNDEPVYIPIYDSVDGTGTNANHDLAGFAAFVVTGWDITNGGQDWPEKRVPSKLGLAQGVENADYCGAPKKNNGAYTGSNSDICIYGYFTEALVESGGFTGGGDEALGLSHAYLTG